VEAAVIPGSKGLTLTGQLGEVMQESVKTAWGFVLSQANGLCSKANNFARVGVHVHVPAGAIPKDGPSAGVTMMAALGSLCARRPLRSDTAMTGEVTLTGLVLPVGGIKEKVLAARRAGIRRVILPKQNEKDLRDLPDDVRQEVRFILVQSAEEVLEAAFMDPEAPEGTA
jgi:ATP-dependent Lon protease